MWSLLVMFVGLNADPNIRVACLTCLGCVVSTPSPLLEVCYIIEPIRPSHRVSENSTHLSSSAAESAGSVGANRSHGTDRLSPGIVTPVLSGTQTPLTESLHSSVVEGEGGAVPTSWLVRLCVRCIMPQLAVDADGTRQPLSASQPLPVRLEALQLLTLLTKGYFMIVRCVCTLMSSLLPLPTRRRLCDRSVCLSVCHSVSRITGKVMSRFNWNLVLWLDLPVGRTD